MSIASADNYIAAVKQDISFTKTASRTAVALTPTSVFDLAGQPGAGTLAVGNTANGIVPTDATAGAPTITNFAAGATGYLTGLDYDWDVPGRLMLFDRLFSAGAYAFNANTTLSGQPSFSSRAPGGVYSDLELWLECVTAFTGNQSVNIGYTNQAGTTGKTTGVIATGVAPIVGQMFRMPLAAGDSGLQKIESVVGSVASAGTFNVHILRRLANLRVNLAGQGGFRGILDDILKQLYQDSSLFLVGVPDGTSTGKPSLSIQVASA